MVAVGVDTHKERHYAAALDQLGQLLGERTFAASAAGYAELQRWAENTAAGHELAFGVEGVGSWGAGLRQHLQHGGHAVVEVERPRRRDRRAGKSDRIDALTAAKCALNNENVSIPRRRGALTAIRALLMARRRRRNAHRVRRHARHRSPLSRTGSRRPALQERNRPARPLARPHAP